MSDDKIAAPERARTVINFEPTGARRCGDCQLCCKLLPVPDIDKKAGQRCKHQKFGVGCAVYRKVSFPSSCALWNCRWLTDPATADLHRPDRSHYVIDVVPDFVTLVQNETGERTNIEVVQIWIDPKHPEAHQDPALLKYLSKLGENGVAAIIRYNQSDAFTLFPPTMASDGQWHARKGGQLQRTRTGAERLAGIAQAKKVMV